MSSSGAVEPVRVSATLAAAGFIAVAGLQLALALGAPLGRVAWGGSQADLSSGLRIASAFAATVLVLAALVVLARASFDFSPVPFEVSRWATWVLVAGLALSALGNFASRSPWERFLMGPIATAQALLCLIIARSDAA
jgi:hypothetical protein